VVLDEVAGGDKVCLGHLLDERGEVHFTLPPKLLFSFGGVSVQKPLALSVFQSMI
jgi:hypothetical protein